MPTYEYICKKCGHTFEELQSMSEEPLKRCPQCHTDNLARVMGTGGAIIFKGSGFYQTDYKKQHTAGGDSARKDPAAKEKKQPEKEGGTGKEAEKKSPEKEKGEKGDSGKGTPGSPPPPPPPASGA
jgi:putative FmdB family regulatory protein